MTRGAPLLRPLRSARSVAEGTEPFHPGAGRRGGILALPTPPLRKCARSPLRRPAARSTGRAQDAGTDRLSENADEILEAPTMLIVISNTSSSYRRGAAVVPPLSSP